MGSGSAGKGREVTSSQISTAICYGAYLVSRVNGCSPVSDEFKHYKSEWEEWMRLNSPAVISAAEIYQYKSFDTALDIGSR